MPDVSYVFLGIVIITMISQRDTFHYVSFSSDKDSNTKCMAFGVNNVVILTLKKQSVLFEKSIH